LDWRIKLDSIESRRGSRMQACGREFGGHGRPRAIDLKFADVSPISALDFDGATDAAELFSAYVGISCILGKHLEIHK
jgi:hypothetical protein